MKIGCSACLLGRACKYNGGHNRNEALIHALEGHEVVPVCPEMAGGLGCPRKPCEQKEGRILAQDGTDCTEAYVLGAERELERVRDCDLVVLQPRSPSCGVTRVYDGTFTGTLVPGEGTFAKRLRLAGIPAVEADAFLDRFS